MAATAPSTAGPKRANDRMLSLIVAGVAILAIAAVWGWSRLAEAPSTERPKPAWLGITRVIAQLNDGRLLKVRVDLHLSDQDAVNALTPHQDAFKSMVEEISGDMSREELEGTEGMVILAKKIRRTANSYLASQRIPQRVKGVMFDEWTLLPS
jgi:flagellar basal body-associated protein FliL